MSYLLQLAPAQSSNVMLGHSGTRRHDGTGEVHPMTVQNVSLGPDSKRKTRSFILTGRTCGHFAFWFATVLPVYTCM